MKSFRQILVLFLFFSCGHSISEKDRVTARTYFELGSNYFHSGKPQDALEEYLKALKLNPEFPELHNALGVLYQMGFRRYKKAMHHYRKAIEFAPDYSAAYNNLGTLYMEMGRYNEAISLFEKALKNILYRTPYFAEGNRGWALYKTGKEKEGIMCLKKAISMNSNYCQGYRLLGMIHMEKKRFALAKKHFSNFAAACPEVSEAHYRLAIASMKTDDKEGAKKAFKECVKTGKDDYFSKECEKSLKLIQ